MIKRLEYTDTFGIEYTIIFAGEESTLFSRYESRVLADGGTFEPSGCLQYALLPTRNIKEESGLTKQQWIDYKYRVTADGGVTECIDKWISGDDVYTFKYGTGSPLNLQWYGERFKSINPSKADISIVVTNSEDEFAINEMVGNRYYVNIYRGDKLFWVGYTGPVFFNSTYSDFPYTVTLSAQDGLARLTKYQPLMIDFNIPYEKHKYTVMEYLQKFLPSNNSGVISNPSVINYYKRTELSGGASLTDVTLDPLVFMKEGTPEYKPMWDILDDILTPLNLKIFQWNAEWYLISQDAEYKGGFDYATYSLNTGERVGGSTIPTDIRPISCDVIAEPDITFLPSNREVRLTKNFQKNTNILTAFTNRQGNFYTGSDNIYLEGNSVGHLSSDRVEGNTDASYVRNNDGRLYQKANYANTTIEWSTTSLKLSEQEDKVIFSGTFLQKDVYSSTTVYAPDEVFYRIIIQQQNAPAMPNKVLYAYEEAGTYKWSTTPKYIEGKITGGKVSIELPNPSDYDHWYKLTVATLPKGPRTPNYYYWLNGIGFEVNSSEYTNIDYKQDVTLYGDINSDNFYTKSLIWGFEHPTFSNDRAYHLSSINNTSGEAYDKFVDENGDIKTAFDWLGYYIMKETSVITRKLRLTSNTSEITPFTLYVDDKDRIYYATGITLHTDGFDVEAIESQTIDSNLLKGDFSHKDFNTDFSLKL